MSRFLPLAFIRSLAPTPAPSSTPSAPVALTSAQLAQVSGAGGEGIRLPVSTW